LLMDDGIEYRLPKLFILGGKCYKSKSGRIIGDVACRGCTGRTHPGRRKNLEAFNL